MSHFCLTLATAFFTYSDPFNRTKTENSPLNEKQFFGVGFPPTFIPQGVTTTAEAIDYCSRLSKKKDTHSPENTQFFSLYLRRSNLGDIFYLHKDTHVTLSAAADLHSRGILLISSSSLLFITFRLIVVAVQSYKVWC